MTRSLKEDNRVIIFGSLTSRTRVFSGLFVSRKILDLSLAFSWMLLVNSYLFVLSSVRATPIEWLSVLWNFILGIFSRVGSSTAILSCDPK
jgi:hypothetical protein